MNISVQQAQFSLSSKYEIATPGAIYSARKAFLSLCDKVELFAPHGRVLATIRGHFSFRTKYDFELSDGKVYHFWCEKLWRGVFTCESAGESFRLYQHKGLNFSIFQNDSQIAAFTKNKVTIGAGDRYAIRINDDGNLIVVICMVLALDCAEHEDDSATVSYDLGNVGPEARPFDASWEPS
jgi:uncharacterized protein YxjI